MFVLQAVIDKAGQVAVAFNDAAEKTAAAAYADVEKTAVKVFGKTRKIAIATFDSHGNFELGLKVAVTVGLAMAFVGVMRLTSH